MTRSYDHPAEAIPIAARRHDIQGVVHVRFSLDRSGQVEDIQIVLSSGFAILDEEAAAMLKRASPLPLPPLAMQGETKYVILPITFRDQIGACKVPHRDAGSCVRTLRINRLPLTPPAVCYFLT